MQYREYFQGISKLAVTFNSFTWYMKYVAVHFKDFFSVQVSHMKWIIYRIYNLF